MENLMIKAVLMKINKNISLTLYLKNIIKRHYVYSSIEDSEVVLVFGRNNAGLMKLSSFVRRDLCGCSLIRISLTVLVFIMLLQLCIC
jgi:hypothetical protein